MLQTHIDAPVDSVWTLLGDPNRHPQWWPKMVEVECADLAEGCRYRGVVAGLFGREEEHEMLVERLEDCREVSIYCEATGVYTSFQLVDAGGGTFVQGHFGAQPNTLGMRAFTAVAGRRYMRSWLRESLDALKRAAEGAPAAS
jgi:uncharacterized protein YndB with AHSA1/START domain